MEKLPVEFLRYIGTIMRPTLVQVEQLISASSPRMYELLSYISVIERSNKQSRTSIIKKIFENGLAQLTPGSNIEKYSTQEFMKRVIISSWKIFTH